MTVELAPEMEQRVRKLAEDFRFSESFLIREAVERFVEDKEDHAAGIESLSAMKYSISLNEMERLSNVAD